MKEGNQTKTCLDIRAEVHERTRKQVGLQTHRGAEQEWTEASKNVWHTLQFLQNTKESKQNHLPLHANRELPPHPSQSQVHFWGWFITRGTWTSNRWFFEADHKLSTNQMVSENTFTPEAPHSSPVIVLMGIMGQLQPEIINRTIMRWKCRQTGRQGRRLSD